MSRLRENPDKLFEVFIEVGKPAEGEDPFILQKYPLDFNDQEVLKSVPKFAFPCDTERYTTTVDHFTFTLTDLDSKFKFGFCRHATGAQTCFCIISFLPWFEVFYNFLNVLAEITNRSEDNDVEDMLRAAFVHEVPSSGLPVTIVARQEMFSFKAPESNKLPCIPASRNLTEYYNAVDTENMTILFASMLHERRIIVTSKKLSRLTAVVHAASSLLYPMFWQHLFIPVLPAFLIDYLSAPMPFVIGVHHSLMEKAESMDLGDAVIVDADKNTVTTEYDDLDNLPDDISSYLRRHLKGEKLKNAMQESQDAISRTFMLSLVKLIGGYRDALKFNEGETITFNPEAFVQSRPLSMQPFLENMLCLQIFQQFINDRLDMLNCGRGFADIFEQECLVHADKLNSQSRYNEWLGKMKKQGKKLHRGGRDVWSDFKVKAKPVMKEASSIMETFSQRAKPVMKEARFVMDSMSHRVYKQAGPAMTSAVESVKTQGKKVASKARTKMNEFKKEDDGTPKSGKSVRLGPKTKSFSKGKSPGIIKDRPSTIVGSPLKSQRPPRPSPTSPMSSHKPHVLMEHPSSERKSHFVSHIEAEKRVSIDDNDIMAFQRVSCNLLADPDIQHAMYKSASAENLPKNMKSLPNNGSSGTLTSSSSTEGDLDQQDSPYFSGKHQHRGGSIQYSNLLDDDDSGIVMTTNSQSSLDGRKYDSGFKTENDAWGGSAEQKFAPPRPAPRKSLTPNTLPATEDRLITNKTAVRERPKPAPRKLSFENNPPHPYGDHMPSNSGDSLIDLGHNLYHHDTFNLSNEFERLDGAGDYVTLKEHVKSSSHTEYSDSGNRRSSVSRTPAMKYSQNATPKRPSIRRERSPVSPDESPQSGSSLLDFDPLLNLNQSSNQRITQSSSGTSNNKQSDNGDSLLKDWSIGDLANITNTPKQAQTLNQSSYLYGHPTPPPRQPINTMPQQRYYTPQPMVHRQTGNMSGGQSALRFNNPLSQMSASSPAPQVPPRPRNRPSLGNTGNQSVNQSADPFDELLNLNQSNSQRKSQQTASWETFN